MANKELFGISEQLDTISRAGAIETVRKAKSIGQTHRMLEQLPSAQRLLEDGTLIVKVQNLSAVRRVIVDEENSQYCKTFYQDGDEDE